MYKPKALCVQCLAGHHLKAILYKSPELWQALPFQDICSAVGSVTEKRMAYMFHMRPDLMGAAGFKPAFNESYKRKPLQYPVMCYGPFYVIFRSEEHTSELQSLMRNPYAFFCLNKKNNI